MRKTFVFTDEDYAEIEKRLTEIENKIGPFKIDQTEFAWSVMENSTENAKKIKEILAKSFMEES